MQVFKAFMKILYRRKVAIFVYIIVFAILLIAMTNSSEESNGKNFVEEKFQYTVFNKDKGEAGEKLEEYLKLENEFVEEKDDKDILLDEMFFRNLDCVVYIPEDFTDRLVKGETQELLEVVLIPGLQKGELAKTSINQFLSAIQIYLQCGYDIDEADRLAREDLSKEATVKMPDGKENQEWGKWVYYFEFLVYILLCVIVIGMGPVLIIFDEKNIGMRNKCSATSLARMNVEKILGCITFVAICYTLFMVMAMILYTEYMLSVKGVLLMILSGIFAMLSVAITFLATQFLKTENALNMVANTLGLVMCFLGGVFVPVSFFSEGVLRISKLMPTYWYIKAIEEINSIKEGMEIPKVILQYYGILMLFTIAIFALGLVATKMRRQKV